MNNITNDENYQRGEEHHRHRELTKQMIMRYVVVVNRYISGIEHVYAVCYHLLNAQIS